MAVTQQAYQFVIDGREAGAVSGRTVTVMNPATGAAVASAPVADEQDVERAVSAARRAFEEGPWPKMSASERGRVLLRVASLLRERVDSLAHLEVQNSGKPIRDARGEVLAAAECFEYYAGAATKWFGETIPVTDRGLDFPLREPIGVVGLIVPWNFPLMIASWKVAPALAVGNTAVLKPASATPLTALALGTIALEAGVPAGVLNVITGPGAIAGMALVRDPGVGKIAFTGETTTGMEIMKAAADTMTRISLELGGKSPNVIFADADLARAIPGAAGAVFGNAGQDCCARSRVFIERAIYDRAVAALVEEARKLRTGDPLEEETQIGSLISRSHRDRVRGYVELGAQEGAEVLCGGGPPHRPAHGRRASHLPAGVGGGGQAMRVGRGGSFWPAGSAPSLSEPTHRV